MASVKSASSGRRATYGVPPEDVTTLPSWRPMSSSWLIEPRWVKNDLPGTSTSWWCRPLGSVSCTWSPGSKGPRGVEIMAEGYRPGSGTSDAGERAVQVAGGQHPVDLAGGLHHQVLTGRGPAHRVEQGHAGQVGGQHQARIQLAGQRAGLDPGPALRRRGHHRGLADDGDRGVVVVHHDQAPGAGLLGPADRLGQRQAG